MMWTGIKAEQVPLVWPAVAELLAPVLKYTDGEYSLADVLDMLEQREAQLWIVGTEKKLKAALVTMIVLYPQFPVLHILWAGGEELDAWAEHIAVLERYAQAQGAHRVRWFGRPGVLRKMQKFGYKQLYVVASKDVSTEVYH